MLTTYSAEVSDSDLRQALLGTWRLVSFQVDRDGAVVKPLGDDPQGYLVYTPDGHMFVQFATRAQRTWPLRPEMLELPPPQPMVEMGFFAYCGTFEVHDDQVIHQREFGVFPRVSGDVTRSVALDGDRLILSSPSNEQAEWQRVH
jgi:hypothetical protein